MKTLITMKVNGWTIKLMAMENIPLRMKINFILENGLKTNKMDLEGRNQMDSTMKVTLGMEKNTVWEYVSLMTALVIKENGKIIKFTAMENTIGQMVEFIMDNGLITPYMVVEFLNGQTVQNIMDRYFIFISKYFQNMKHGEGILIYSDGR